jgi:hypothetical protein
MSCELCEQEIRYNGYENYATWCVVNLLTSNKEDDAYWTTFAKCICGTLHTISTCRETQLLLYVYRTIWLKCGSIPAHCRMKRAEEEFADEK